MAECVQRESQSASCVSKKHILHGKKTDFLLQEVLKMLYTQTVLAFARKTTAGVWTFFWTYLM